MNVFTIPQHLRGDPANPARILRSRLMAEHLGLRRRWADALFADPHLRDSLFHAAAWYERSRWQPLNFFGSLPPDVPIGTAGSVSGLPAEGPDGSAICRTRSPMSGRCWSIRRRTLDPTPTRRDRSTHESDLLRPARHRSESGRRAAPAAALWPDDIASLTPGYQRQSRRRAGDRQHAERRDGVHQHPAGRRCACRAWVGAPGQIAFAADMAVVGAARHDAAVLSPCAAGPRHPAEGHGPDAPGALFVAVDAARARGDHRSAAGEAAPQAGPGDRLDADRAGHGRHASTRPPSTASPTR